MNERSDRKEIHTRTAPPRTFWARGLTASLAVVIVFLLTAFAYAQPTGQASPNPPSSAGADQTFYDSLRYTYLLGLSLVGISALFMIVWGGIYYIIAGDNTSFLEKGRGKIKNALWGIFIAAISYALLFTINPDLVKFRIGTPEEYQQ